MDDIRSLFYLKLENEMKEANTSFGERGKINKKQLEDIRIKDTERWEGENTGTLLE